MHVHLFNEWSCRFMFDFFFYCNQYNVWFDERDSSYLVNQQLFFLFFILVLCYCDFFFFFPSQLRVSNRGFVNVYVEVCDCTCVCACALIFLILFTPVVILNIKYKCELNFYKNEGLKQIPPICSKVQMLKNLLRKEINKSIYTLLL